MAFAIGFHFNDARIFRGRLCKSKEFIFIERIKKLEPELIDNYTSDVPE